MAFLVFGTLNAKNSNDTWWNKRNKTCALTVSLERSGQTECCDLYLSLKAQGALARAFFTKLLIVYICGILIVNDFFHISFELLLYKAYNDAQSSNVVDQINKISAKHKNDMQ